MRHQQSTVPLFWIAFRVPHSNGDNGNHLRPEPSTVKEEEGSIYRQAFRKRIFSEVKLGQFKNLLL